jgi:hypothetical protein
MHVHVLQGRPGAPKLRASTASTLTFDWHPAPCTSRIGESAAYYVYVSATPDLVLLGSDTFHSWMCGEKPTIKIPTTTTVFAVIIVGQACGCVGGLGIFGSAFARPDVCSSALLIEQSC